MGNYVISEVITKKDRTDFLALPYILYKDIPYWIAPLETEIKTVFDPSKNKMFSHGKLCRWILKDGAKVVGRIAAFIDYDTAKLNDQPTGGCGFFECINSKEAAYLLFDKAKEWLKENKMEAMDGPINFGSREKWWGLLVDGFTEQPSYGMNYNPPYYQELMESYGFKNYFYQYSYLRPVSTDKFSPIFKDKAERIARNPEYRFEKLSKKHLDEAKRNFRVIYNKSWVNHSGIKEMTEEDAEALVSQLKPIIDERLIFFAFHNDAPIGFFVQIPEINQVIKHLNGKFSLYHKLKFLYLLKVKKVCNRVMGLIFAIVPEFRGLGIEGALVMAFAKEAFAPKFPYKDIDLTWVGDFNPLMMRFQQQIGGTIYKTHATYRLLFDEYKQEHEFKRCPRMGKNQ